MSSEHPAIGPTEGHENNKALIALATGMFSIACVLAATVLVLSSPSRLNGTRLEWLVLPLMALIGGTVSSFVGSIAWIDVRRGITEKRLFEAQLGAVLGGLAVFFVLAAVVALMVVVLFLLASFGAAWSATDGGLD